MFNTSELINVDKRTFFFGGVGGVEIEKSNPCFFFIAIIIFMITADC